MVMGVLAIDLQREWITHSAREEKCPFVCKRRSKDDVKEGGGGVDFAFLLRLHCCSSSLLCLFFYLPSFFSQEGSRSFKETQSEIHLNPFNSEGQAHLFFKMV